MFERLWSLLPASVRVRLPKVKPNQWWLWAYGVVPTLFLIGALGLRWVDPPPLIDFRHWVFDEFQRRRPRAYPNDSPVRIIDLDDETLAQIGQWPWPRTKLAAVLQRLQELGAGVVAFDVVFAEKDRTSPAQFAESLPLDAALKARLKKLPDHDRLFAKVMADYTVVTGYSLIADANTVRPEVKRGFLLMAPRKAGAVASFDKGVEVKDLTDFLPAYYAGAVKTIDVLEKAAAGNGNFSINPDRDGIIRRVPLMYKLDGKVYPSLVAEALRVAQGAGGYKVKSSGASGEESYGAFTGITAVRIGEAFTVPTDGQGNVLLYDTGYVRERYIPLWEIFKKDFDAKRLEGALVFFGTSAAGLKDIRATPLNPNAPGVEIHAQIAEQILFQTFLVRPDYAVGVEFVFMLVLGLALILLMPKIGAAWMGAASLAALAGAFGSSWRLFTHERLLFDPVYPAIVVALIYLAASLIHFLKTEYEQRSMRRSFGRYVSPDLVKRLADDPGQVSLGGESREMTLMFSDIRGFTTISEQFDAEGLTDFINAYLTPMTKIILDKRGTIDKYMGDCIMAFWNAPLDDDDHVIHACDAALTMSKALKGLNKTWRAEAEVQGRTYIPINAGVGLNTGICCVGNMGSNLRLDYSVLGDEVNLASRLEGQSKTYGIDIVIGAKTNAVAEQRFATVELDLIQVKGKTVPVRIYTLLGDLALKESPAFVKLREAHAEMIDAYRSRKFELAEEKISECRKLYSGLSGVYDLYDKRIAAFRTVPPDKDWDGVFRATSK